MKIAFSGCRDKTVFRSRITDVLQLLGPDFQSDDWILAGDAKGVDECVRRYAELRQFNLRIFEANWDKYQRSAGPIRNKLMIDEADTLVAFWDGKSRGTKNCIRCATDKGIPVLIMPI